MTLFSLRDADRKVGLYREAIIPRAEQAAAAALAGYRAGRVQLADLVDAERVLIQFRLDYARTVANRAQRLAELEMMVGRALPAEADRPTTSPADAGDRGSQKEARP
jgi:outer membrane protein TolC